MGNFLTRKVTVSFSGRTLFYGVELEDMKNLGVDVGLHGLLALAVDEGVWSASRADHFTPRERARSTQ